MNYYISDLHFFHYNVLKFDKRPFSSIEEMNKKLVENWNTTVGDEDSVYFLGDFSFGKAPETTEILKSLKGHKILIKGNHDGRFLKHKPFLDCWDGIYDILEVNDVVNDIPITITLCHYPILTFKRRYTDVNFHFYGHVHITPDEKEIVKFAKEFAEFETKTNQNSKRLIYGDMEIKTKMYNVGCMTSYMNYTPQTAASIIWNGEEYSLDQK